MRDNLVTLGTKLSQIKNERKEPGVSYRSEEHSVVNYGRLSYQRRNNSQTERTAAANVMSRSAQHRQYGCPPAKAVTRRATDSRLLSYYDRFTPNCVMNPRRRVTGFLMASTYHFLTSRRVSTTDIFQNVESRTRTP